jgi:hypothetical protein
MLFGILFNFFSAFIVKNPYNIEEDYLTILSNIYLGGTKLCVLKYLLFIN